MFADQIGQAIAAAPRDKLPELTALLWRAFGEGQVTEAEAERLSTLIEVRRMPKVPTVGGLQDAQPRSVLNLPSEAPRRAVGSRPRTDASMERRRRWAASGRLPPGIASRFTLAEAAVLAVVSSETVRRGDCRLCIDHIAAIAGVGRSTVKTAIRQARTLGLLTVEERAQTAWRNLSNVVRVVSKEWQAWMRLTRRPAHQGGGVKSVTGTNTQVPNPETAKATAPSKGCRQAAADLDVEPHRASERVAGRAQAMR